MDDLEDGMSIKVSVSTQPYQNVQKIDGKFISSLLFFFFFFSSLKPQFFSFFLKK